MKAPRRDFEAKTSEKSKSKQSADRNTLMNQRRMDPMQDPYAIRTLLLELRKPPLPYVWPDGANSERFRNLSEWMKRWRATQPPVVNTSVQLRSEINWRYRPSIEACTYCLTLIGSLIRIQIYARATESGMGTRAYGVVQRNLRLHTGPRSSFILQLRKTEAQRKLSKTEQKGWPRHSIFRIEQKTGIKIYVYKHRQSFGSTFSKLVMDKFSEMITRRLRALVLTSDMKVKRTALKGT